MTPFANQEGIEWLPASRELGVSIRAARRAKGMSQGELASLVRRSQAAISQLEHGRWKRVPRGLLVDVADALGIEATTLQDAALGSREERVAAALREALAPMADRPATEQADLGAVIRSLIAWRYGPEVHW